MELSTLFERHRPWVVVGAAVVPFATCGVLSVFRLGITPATAVLVLVLVVVAAASTGARVAGVVTAVSCGVWFDFFLTKPYHTLLITGHDDVEATVLLVLIGAAVTEVALWGHRQQARANRRAGYLDGVLGTAELVTLAGEPPQRLTDHVADQIRHVLGVSRCRFVAGPVRDDRMPMLDHDGVVTRRGHLVDVERDGLPTDDNIVLTVTRARGVLGHYLITAAAEIIHPTLEQRKVAVLLADQTAAALSSTRSPSHPAAGNRSR